MFVTEAKVFADENGSDSQVANENLVDKFLRREAGELVSEGEDDSGFDVEISEDAEALILGG